MKLTPLLWSLQVCFILEKWYFIKKGLEVKTYCFTFAFIHKLVLIYLYLIYNVTESVPELELSKHILADKNVVYYIFWLHLVPVHFSCNIKLIQ
jgi:hypothetical protein